MGNAFGRSDSTETVLMPVYASGNIPRCQLHAPKMQDGDVRGDYDLGDILGRGASGTVLRAHRREGVRSGVPVAVKIIQKVRRPRLPSVAAAALRPTSTALLRR